MIRLKGGREALGQPDRDRRDAEIARAADKRRITWALAGAVYETQIVKAHPMPGSHAGHRATDYPTAVRAATAAWDEEMRKR